MISEEVCGSCRWRERDNRGWGATCGNVRSAEYGDPVRWEHTCARWEDNYGADEKGKADMRGVQQG